MIIQPTYPNTIPLRFRKYNIFDHISNYQQRPQNLSDIYIMLDKRIKINLK